MAMAAAPIACSQIRAKGQYYFVEDRASMQSLARHARQIGLLCPAWYTFGPHGKLEETIGPVTRETIARNRMKVVPLVANKGFDPAIAHAVLGDARNREASVEALSEAAERNGFAGYELDFENVPMEDRDAYVAMVAALSVELRKRNRTLSIAVPAPLLPAPPGSVYRPTASAPSFDYRELARHADWISLMAYDEHTQPGQPGPIASHPWVEACLMHLLEAVPAKKLKLGIPFYHRRWSAQGVAEGSFAEAAMLAQAYGIPLGVQKQEREISFRFSGDHGDEVVWLHGAQSLMARLDLASRYRLAGFAAWRLGQEDPDFWTLIGGGKERA